MKLGGFLSATALALLAGCTSMDDLKPTASGSMSSIAAMVATAHPRFGDNDPHDWTLASAPTGYAVHGTDVSKYQRDVDWPTARDAGISFAFIKATEGGDRVDDYFARHWRGAKAAGVPRAAYHFYYFCRTAAEQARWFIRNVPKERGALPPVLDMEWNPDSPTCKKRPKAETVRSEMRVFLETVERHYGQKPIIYTSIDFYEDNGLSGFHGYPYWLRSVAGHPSSRYGDRTWTFWQYTGTGVVPGIDGNADINVFNGSAATWRKWVRANAG
jgi:lysozyme